MLAIDWVMKTSKRRETKTVDTLETADDLDFADHLVFLYNIKQHIQEKTKLVTDNSARLGLTINIGMSKVFIPNAFYYKPITI
ncbi:hypothetical protein DPMN_055905 [Dreissena polymorpha]|uniref:Uncharacterized protein n=1 Tax=Dreissena polymorpha TaxID=45954 RepID=A0A9D4HR16_DREPO|nr:hypothetical protein DPMN_055905 [Dreissena polymorpha]